MTIFARSFTKLGLGLILVVSAGACAAAAVGAAAGAAGAIAYTERGAESNLAASVDEVLVATDAVFGEMGIEVTSRTNREDGSGAEIEGEQGDSEVVVTVERNDDGLTHVVVTSRENAVDYDRDHAEEILRAIVERA